MIDWESITSVFLDMDGTLLDLSRSSFLVGIGHPIAIRCNDSGRPPREITEFPSVDDFREPMPCGFSRKRLPGIHPSFTVP